MEQKKKALGRGLEQLFSSEVFDFDEDNLATVTTQPTDDNVELATTALENCPTDAIEKI